MQARLLPFTLAALLVILILCPGADAHAKKTNCADWAGVVARGETDRLPAGRILLVSPFTDFTKVAGDEWLSAAIRDLFTDLFRSATDLRVLAGGTAGAAGTPDAAIGGSFQHAGGKLRIFIAATDGRTGRLLKQVEVLVPYPGNAELFTKAAEAAGRILGALNARVDGTALAAVRDATASTRAWESFSRGREALRSLTAAKAEVARAFFEDAVRLDGTSALGSMGLVDLHTLMGFVHRQRREPFELEFELAEEAMGQLKRQARRAIPMAAFRSTAAGRGGGLENRYLAGNAAFLEGAGLARAGEKQGAKAAFTKAVEAVSEDAISWYHLSRLEAELGNTAAATAALQKAYAINPCIEQP